MKSLVYKTTNVTMDENHLKYMDIRDKNHLECIFHNDISWKNIRSKIKRDASIEKLTPLSKGSSGRLEEGTIPPGVYIFYILFVKNGYVPKMEEYLNEYLKIFCIPVNKKKKTFKFHPRYIYNDIYGTFSFNELCPRVLRAYFALCRELDLLFYLMEKARFKSSYDIQVDVFKGIDIIIEHNDKKIGLATFIDSERSNASRIKKKLRTDYMNKDYYTIIDVPAVIAREPRFDNDECSEAKIVNTENINGIDLYSPNFMNSLIKEILSIK